VDASSAGLLRLIYGYQVSQAIHVAAALGIPDQLAEGPRAVGDLASSIGAHAGALYRLLRALAAVEVLHEEPDGSFALTDLGEALRGPAGSLAAFIGRPNHWTAWGQLLHSVRTGENAFRAIHGVDVWEYRAHHPEEGAIFDAAMTGFSRRVNAAVAVYYWHDDYSDLQSGTTVTPGFTEDSFDINLTLGYALSQHLNAQLGYDHTEVSSGESVRDYSRNRVWAGFNFAF